MDKFYENIKLVKMFDHISSTYDLLNHLLSFGIDIYWRKKIIHLIYKYTNKQKYSKFSKKMILDLATGTGDIAILLAKKFQKDYIIAIDPSAKMLQIAKMKIKNHSLEKKIKLIQGYSYNIPFNNETFDIITISFGVRNFIDLNMSFREIFRILKPIGLLGILEFSYPSNFFIKKIYHFYSNFILKHIGNKISNNIFAYDYLKNSIHTFSFFGKKMKDLLKNHNIPIIYMQKLTFGIVTIYLSKKQK
ncbi:bifunctional demethylmenaquinone methyltransferase/2-methoxy-6-polyprenyl-1,4-benzoquinol methylase UbiE [Blattabacterium cuenoti]|uniref:bifunctional demethylmenaquinone methyltransferase/2-methoxy-6-polyprenyl-1,4-benzoquinol methylase UbiE n=1 Tax=Blattabacterium cuenoti TaxID=1653831 RepID=UPI00163BDBE1|nr:bifunctional demethylmenaquinone methyltransferase/2-methoxy-6-polyprenyl-1,4-benzoquinol methylase UbiE [Blattabacterium cuenoti]